MEVLLNQRTSEHSPPADVLDNGYNQISRRGSFTCYLTHYENVTIFRGAHKISGEASCNIHLQLASFFDFTDPYFVEPLVRFTRTRTTARLISQNSLSCDCDGSSTNRIFSCTMHDAHAQHVSAATSKSIVLSVNRDTLLDDRVQHWEDFSLPTSMWRSTDDIMFSDLRLHANISIATPPTPHDHMTSVSVLLTTKLTCELSFRLSWFEYRHLLFELKQHEEREQLRVTGLAA